jgi:DNA-binding response OmpR family regulator
MGIRSAVIDCIGRHRLKQDVYTRVTSRDTASRDRCDMQMDEEPQTLVLGPLEVRVSERFARLQGHPLVLSALEFKLLTALARRAGQTVRRESLYREVWGYPLRLGDRSVDVYVHKLRGKLEQALPGWRFIHTHTGWGYRLEPEQNNEDPMASRSASLRSVGGSSRRARGSGNDRLGAASPANYAQGSHT